MNGSGSNTSDPQEFPAICAPLLFTLSQSSLDLLSMKLLMDGLTSKCTQLLRLEIAAI
jgi:hypothetical protein